MSSNLKVNTILPSTGTSIGIGTAGGTGTFAGNVHVNNNLSVVGVSTFTETVKFDKISDSISMADSLVHTGNTGTKLQFHSNTVELHTNSEQRLQINSGGNLIFKSPNNNTGEQPASLTWINENSAGTMAKISVIREAVSQAPTALAFYTSPNVDTAANSGQGDITERLRITSDGKVGISSAIPTNILTVHSNDNNQFAIKSGDSNADIVLADSGGSARIRHSNTNFEIWTGGVAGSYYAQSSGRRLSIDSNGNVTKPNNPAFIAGRTEGNYTATIGTFPFNVARLNRGNCYSTSTYKFTAPVAGVYYFFAQVYYNNNSGSYRVGFRKEPSGGSAIMLNTSAHAMVGNDNSQTLSIIESLGVGDTVRLFSDQNASIQCYYGINGATYGAHTYFMGYLIG